MEIQEIITRNRELQVQVRALNARAGEQVFPVMSFAEMDRWLKDRLNDARCISEVKNLDMLLLPPLDAELVDLVRDENPDEIKLLGHTFLVDYRNGSVPRITLTDDLIIAHVWKDLPDAGVKLPGGRRVEVVVPFSYYKMVSGQDIPELKSRCVSYVNEVLWDNWPQEGRPVITLPDFVDPTSFIPEIIRCQYGVNVVDGSALVAFGAVVFKRYRYSSSDPYFETKWFQAHEEAMSAKAESATKFESLREEVIKQRQIEEARKALSSLQFREGWYELNELRFRVERCGFVPPITSEPEKLQIWMREANRLIAEATEALDALAKKKAEALKPVSSEKVSASLEGLKARFGQKEKTGMTVVMFNKKKK